MQFFSTDISEETFEYKKKLYILVLKTRIMHSGVQKLMQYENEIYGQ